VPGGTMQKIDIAKRKNMKEFLNRALQGKASNQSGQ
jgi:hypothetical protein